VKGRVVLFEEKKGWGGGEGNCFTVRTRDRERPKKFPDKIDFGKLLLKYWKEDLIDIEGG